MDHSVNEGGNGDEVCELALIVTRCVVILTVVEY